MKRYNTPHRHRVIKTRLTEEEYAEFSERVTLCQMSQSEYIRQALIKSRIRSVITVSTVNDELLSAVGKLTAEYGKIGGNLNQIARCLNEYGAPYNALSQEVRAATAELAASGEPPKVTKFETDKEKLRRMIRTALSSAVSFEDFSGKLLQQGVTVKESRGRLSYLTPDRTKPITARKLGDDFGRAAASAGLHETTGKLKAVESTLREKKDLQKQLLAYIKTKPARDGLRAQKTEKAKRACREQHESEFIISESAARYFKAQGISKLPASKALQAEIEQLMREKNTLYNEYREKKENVRELQTIKGNIDQILRRELERGKGRDNER